ncbi:MAG: hypothetical protein ACI4W1_04315 [Ruminococcus sp.]
MSMLYSEPYPCNAIVGYEGDKVIVKQDDGLLFFAEIPENLISMGETINPDELRSIRELPQDEQKKIVAKYKDMEV